MNRAVVLLSGGLDSATTLAIARSGGRECYALSFGYGQRHAIELRAAARVAAHLGAREHRVIDLDPAAFRGSSLTGEGEVPRGNTATPAIPSTYVPARNTIFLSFALGWAEVLCAEDIWIGVTAVDYSGYPDCRPAYIAAFERMAALATKAGVEGHPVAIRAPLIDLAKCEIIRRGAALGVDYSLTHSCYDPSPQDLACGTCDACRHRRRGFEEAGIADPTRYVAAPPAARPPAASTPGEQHAA